MMAKEKPPITVVGDVGGRIAIIVVRCCRDVAEAQCVLCLSVRLLSCHSQLLCHLIITLLLHFKWVSSITTTL